ncbi:MAG TPA: hypothetical protein VMT46_15400 [Anaerolineaceae bacterium]|nr:hypothetical protein [Anaerolineaceae bacterium]
MKSTPRTLLRLLVLFCLIFGSQAASVQAQDDRPGQPTSPKRIDPMLPLGLRPALQSEPTDLAPQAVSDNLADTFGYTYKTSVLGEVTYNWVEIYGLGTNSGLTGDDVTSGPINLGFTFRYYGLSYTSIYLNTNGVLSFNDVHDDDTYDNSYIPNASAPNNLIAVFWDDLEAANNGNGVISYYTDGTAPNRRFIVEWYKVNRVGQSGQLTFEAILEENSNRILMQYKDVNGLLTSATVGIEDEHGSQGLPYLYNITGIANNLAVQYTYPAAGARLSAFPMNDGKFTTANAQEHYTLEIANTGDWGDDTVTLTKSSPWPLTIYSDANETVEVTGPINLPQERKVTLYATISTPILASIGDHNKATITVSSNKGAQNRIISLEEVIPAPFAQAYRNYSDAAMQIQTVGLGAVHAADITPPNQGGIAPAVIEMPSKNLFYAWTMNDCLDVSGGCTKPISEIEYMILGHNGVPITGVAKIQNNHGLTNPILDTLPAIATVTNPDNGMDQIALLWQRSETRLSDNKVKKNVMLAILNYQGSILHTFPMTGNDFLDPNDPNFHNYFSYALTGTTGTGNYDNCWFMVWEQQTAMGGFAVNDLYYAVKDFGGTDVKTPPMKLTSDSPGTADGYINPNLAALPGNNVLLTWNRMGNHKNDIYYSVSQYSFINDQPSYNLSSINRLLPPSSPEPPLQYGAPDATWLPNGNAIVAWTSGSILWYALFQGGVSGNPGMVDGLVNPFSVANDFVSVTTDTNSRVTLTWTDTDFSNRSRLYYGLVDGADGTKLTSKPIIYKTDPGGALWETNHQGFANTPYSPTTNLTDVYVQAPANLSWSLGQAGTFNNIDTLAGNYGLTNATGIVVQASVDSNLTIDPAGISPTPSDQNGNDLTWNLPSLQYLDLVHFIIPVKATIVTKGAAYQITWSISADQQDPTNPVNLTVNNQATTHIYVGDRLNIYLPLVRR